ncbi:MAG: patatin-like phospholipase family protein [Chloroflexales bacterium]|nr:patatin-like phospholipase family protein [Chloroflexales bacterium]
MSRAATMQRSKTALVLAGGGVSGAAYEIGALCAIDNLLNQLSVNDLDIYVGTSAGALVSACLANGLTPRTLVTLLDSSVLGLDQLEPHHVFSFNFADTLKRSQRLPGALVTALQQIMSDGGRMSLLDFIETLAVGLPTGLYDGSALEYYVREALTQPGRSNDFRNLSHELAIIATNLDTGERAIFGQAPLDTVPISLAVAASAAVPLVYRPVRINDTDYTDGGVRGTASLDVAIERGAQLIVCINPMVPFDNSRHPVGKTLSDDGIQRVGNQVFRTFVHAGLHYHLKQVRRRHPEVDIILIEPRRDDSIMFDDSIMRYRTRLTIARHAFETVANNLVENCDYYQTLLTRHGFSINIGRVQHALQMLDQAGNNSRAVLAAMALNNMLATTPIHMAPGGLAQTLAELDRLLERIDGVDGQY